MKKEQILQNIAELRTYNGKWRPKWLRNLRLYTYSMNVSLDQIKEGNVIGYFTSINNSYTSTINENVIQSAIDALVSQLAAKNAIPFFTTIDGTFEQQQIAKQTEQYFSSLYDEQNVTGTITDAFRDACIFGNGFVYINPLMKKIQKALPWQVMYRPSEDTYGNITRVFYERKWYPTSLLPFETKNKGEYVTYGEYYDTVNNVKAYLINNEIVKVEDYPSGVIPFIQIKYQNPVYGKDACSVVDMLYGIQMKIHEIYKTVGAAIDKNPAQTFIVPQGSDVKVTQLNNSVGQVLSYKPIEGVTNPVMSVTPDFIANQYIETVQMLKNDAYELVGISKLSAQSVKPTGVDSGRAMKTLNDIESERFEVQFKAIIRAYCDVARVFIKVMNPEDLILPEDRNRLLIKWASVQDIYSKMKVQFSSMDSLSKDPTQRASEIDMLVARGVIPQSKASLYYEMPDSESAYSYANVSMNAVLSIINQAITRDDYEIPPYIPLDLLCNEITTTMLSLKSCENEQNSIDLKKLETLYKEALKMKNAIDSQAQQNVQQTDEQNYAIQLQRQCDTIYKTELARATANLEAQKAASMNNGTNII